MGTEQWDHLDSGRGTSHTGAYYGEGGRDGIGSYTWCKWRVDECSTPTWHKYTYVANLHVVHMYPTTWSLIIINKLKKKKKSRRFRLGMRCEYEMMRSVSLCGTYNCCKGNFQKEITRGFFRFFTKDFLHHSQTSCIGNWWQSNDSSFLKYIVKLLALLLTVCKNSGIKFLVLLMFWHLTNSF